jgi:regulator of replication initiation timing
MSIRPPINGKATSFHPEVIKLNEAMASSDENVKKVRQRIQTVRDKNTVASVMRKKLQKKLDDQFEWFSAVAEDDGLRVFMDDNGELVIIQS